MTTIMNELYKCLAKIGFEKPFVRRFLPEWWEDSLTEYPGAVQQLKLHLAHCLGVEAISLLDNCQIPRIIDLPSCRFKQGRNANKDKSQILTAIATAVARIVITGIGNKYCPFKSNVQELRQHILHQEYRWVGFEQLLDLCWLYGIPVIHLNYRPKGSGQLDGIAMTIESRPVIVLLSKKKKPAWQLFILAHELGHILAGHLNQAGIIIDQKISMESTNPEEQQANQNALLLLTGDGETQFTSATGQWLDAESLAHSALCKAQELKIDPGHIVLNYAKTHNQWGAANNALKELEGNMDALTMIRQKLREHLSIEMLPKDSLNFVYSITGIKAHRE